MILAPERFEFLSLDSSSCGIQQQTVIKEEKNEKSFKQVHKRAQFDLTVNQVHFVPNRIDMKIDEIRNRWYFQSDYDIIKSQNQVLIRLMSIGNYRREIESDNHSSRGLEIQTSRKAAEKRRNARLKTLKAVLLEQLKQSEESRHDVERIALVMRRRTKNSKEEAVGRAMKDARQATVVHIEEVRKLQNKHDEVKANSRCFHARESMDVAFRRRQVPLFKSFVMKKSVQKKKRYNFTSLFR